MITTRRVIFKDPSRTPTMRPWIVREIGSNSMSSFPSWAEAMEAVGSWIRAEFYRENGLRIYWLEHGPMRMA